MANETKPQRPRQPVATDEADRIERERGDEPLAGREEPLGAVVGEAASARDPDSGKLGTTNPRAAAPFGSQRPTGVVPPKHGDAKWLAIVAAGVVGVILILLVLA